MCNISAWAYICECRCLYWARYFDPWELKLQGVISYQNWVLGIQLMSSAQTVSFLNQGGLQLADWWSARMNLGWVFDTIGCRAVCLAVFRNDQYFDFIVIDTENSLSHKLRVQSGRSIFIAILQTWDCIIMSN